MRNPFISILGRLSVGKKLLLIYLLDLTAVIYISSILINEKYIAILDPDLDSYYTMSLIVLRYPELIELVHGISAQLQKQRSGAGGRAATHARSTSFSKGGSMPRPRV